MALDISKITTTATGLANLILVSPQRSNSYKPELSNGELGDAILFHSEAENTATLDSDITDHYVEDNSAISDQIALRPEMITVTGFIGELNDVVPVAERALTALRTKLSVVAAYTPEMSTTALNLYNQAFQAYQLAKSVQRSVESWKTINGGGESVIGSDGLTAGRNQNKQQIAFQQFYGHWRNRTLFTIQTPWAVFENMAIKSLRAIQNAETDTITDFEITFKMIRYAKVKRVADVDDVLARQKAELKNMGSQKGSPVDESLDSNASEILSAIGGL